MKHILEGPDGTGKTYFAEHTLKGSKYFCSDTPPKNLRELYVGIVDDICFLDNNAYANSVLDRSFIVSQYVYTTAMKRRPWITKEFAVDYLEMCSAKDIQIRFSIYDDPFKTPKQLLKDEDKALPIPLLNSLYYAFFKSVSCLFNVSLVFIEDILEGRET